MKKIKNYFVFLLSSTLLFCSCSKYAGNTNTQASNSSGGNSVGATPIDNQTGQGNSGSTGGVTTPTTPTDSVDAVYVQGTFIEDRGKTFFARNNNNGTLSLMASNGNYTKLANAPFTFHMPADNPSNVGTAIGAINFPNNGYYTALIQNTAPQLVVLNNGKEVNPPTSKSYVRFMNITVIDTNVSVNVELNGPEKVYFSYRKPFDIYQNNTSTATTWTSIYSQLYNTTHTNFTAITPGFYNGEIYLSNNVELKPKLAYNFLGGKKYTILVRQAAAVFQEPTKFFYTVLLHN
jgi:hypothetical protein